MLILLIILLLVAFGLYKLVSGSSRFHADENSFRQGKVTVDFATKKITIGSQSYPVTDVQSLESKTVSSLTTDVFIKVDDFKKPIHTVKIIGFGNAGEKFMQRLSTALRKAGGPSFY